MLGFKLHGVCIHHELAGADAACGNYMSYFWFAHCYGAGLIEDDYLGTARLLKRYGALKHDAVFCTEAASDHYGHGSGKPQGARAAYYKNGYAPCKGVAEISASKHPYYNGNCGDAYHYGNENSGYFVRDLCYGCLGRGGIADHLYDL